MNDIKKKLLEQIERKAERMSAAREAAATNKNVESYAVEFFKQVENIPALGDGGSYMFTLAYEGLMQRVKTLDPRVSIKVMFRDDEKTVQGVLIKWSEYFIHKNSINPELYIDVSQAIFM